MSIKYDFVDLPTQARKNFKGAPFVSALQFQKNGDLLCGLLFASANLFKITFDDKGIVQKISDQGIEEKIGDSDLWGVGHGLRGTSTGDTVFSTWHGGFLSGMVGGLFKKNLDSVAIEKLKEFCVHQNGGSGSFARHSIVQIISGEYIIRRSKESGLLWDVAHIGDYIFGLEMGAVWREPYLHSEKRETLRNDLGFNYLLNKDESEEGLFWFAGQDQRVFRLGLTDIKAKPTTLKIPGETGIDSSVASSFDGWLYCVCDGAKKVVRVRRNPVSASEEMQTVFSSDGRIDGIEVFDSENGAKLIVAVATTLGVEIFSTTLTKEIDPEDMGEVPKLVKIGELEGLAGVNQLALSLSSTEKKLELWAGVGNWETLAKSSEKSRGQIQLVRFEI